MDEFKLKELKDLRDAIIKRHLLIMLISLIISIFITISFFKIKNQTNSILFLFAIFSCHFPIYIFIIVRTKNLNSNFRYQYLAGLSLMLILFYSLAIIIFTKTKKEMHF